MRLADLARLNAARAARRPIALVTDITTNSQRIVDAEALEQDALGEAVAERMRLGKSGLLADGVHFVTVQVPSVRLVVIGAVHISQALATMARLTELDVTIIDPRTAFATPERFPDVRLLAEWPDEAIERIGLDPYTAVCLLTHDPKIDDPALVAALKTGCFYIGALGSRKTHGRRLDRMREHGFDDAALARIHAPIGLDIGAVSPAEIAVAILGEIIAALRRKPRRDERAAAEAAA
ncbi:XdhC/CoxF family protein [Beijerinckiaceae bacterium RH AL1]|nr:XdhC family protein [Beijerinckiaceae bacterium]VVB46079.1 XdhC/CoxF family protein [Beijerinckiaceae bacterium RH CH11]VVB46161.1 XdhC/CoxF family protein [Beijerinckiaceae bacterium RH AL8]VVC55192.1 XdhC/CoxF family protein [Beijerinckiaceae bacterium RH AL1]